MVGIRSAISIARIFRRFQAQDAYASIMTREKRMKDQH